MQSTWLHTTEPIELTADEAHVWSVPLEAAPWSGTEQWALLSADERRRAEKFRTADASRRFVEARTALRVLLGRYTDALPSSIQFEYAANGKPRLPDSPAANLQFNLAHSGELALIAITRDCEVGVDVEKVRRVQHLQEIAKRYFHLEEAARLAVADATERDSMFFHYWSGKEAVLKALGTGVTQSLDFSVLACSRTNGAWIDVPSIGCSGMVHCWLEPLTPASGYLAAVAFLGQMRRTRCLAFR